MAAGSDSTPRFDHWGMDIADPVPETPAPIPQGPDRRGRLPRLTRLRLVLIAVVGVAAVAGVIHVAAGGSPQPTPAHLSRASEHAVAAAINLKAADLPGFSLEGSSNDVSAGGNPGGQFKSCFGASLPSGSSEPAFGSPGFSEQGSYGYVGVGSQVSFVSAAQLRRDAAIARNARFPQCFAQAFAAMTFRAQGVTITGSNPETQTLSTSPPSASGVFPVLAMRASMTWTIRGIPVPVAFDIFLVAVGHDELSFYSFALGRPYSSAAEERLVSLLVTRALAQPH